MHSNMILSLYSSALMLLMAAFVILTDTALYILSLHCFFNSVFALASPEELKESLARWREKINNGTADQCLAESEELRKTIGLSTSVVAYKL